jgi:hypothetical protein
MASGLIVVTIIGTESLVALRLTEFRAARSSTSNKTLYCIFFSIDQAFLMALIAFVYLPWPQKLFKPQINVIL